MIQIVVTRRIKRELNVRQIFSFEIPSNAASARDKATAKNFEDYEGGKCVTRRDNINFNIAAVSDSQL